MIRSKIVNTRIKNMALSLGFKSATVIESENFISRPNILSFFGFSSKNIRYDKFRAIKIIVNGRSGSQYEINMQCAKQFKVDRFLMFTHTYCIEDIGQTYRDVFDEMKTLRKKIIWEI